MLMSYSSPGLTGVTAFPLWSLIANGVIVLRAMS